MKITDDEVRQIRRLAVSSSIQGITQAVIRDLDEASIARLLSGYLYLQANGRPNRDFLDYLAKRELWTTMSIGLNVLGAVLPAMIFDKEFRTLAFKAGLNKGFEVGTKMGQKKVAEMPSR